MGEPDGGAAPDLCVAAPQPRSHGEAMLMRLAEEAAAGRAQLAIRAPQELLRPGEVHLWCGTIEGDIAGLRTRVDLSESEWARGHGLAEGRTRETFLVARKVLRAVLGRYSGRDPRWLQFSSEPNGKPYLLQPGVNEPLYFNLSHTAGLFGIAITTTGELGFDVERLDRRFDLFTLAEQILTPRERLEWASLPEKQRPPAVLRYWTRKEAMLKASGDALSVSPDAVEAGLSHDPKGWTVLSLTPSPGFIGCIAARWPIWRLERRCLTWETNDYE
jgi:4'-phosphopantetheinyl transferase